MKALLDEGCDAVFVGSGAPQGKELDIPGRYDARPTSTSASSGSSRSHFGHIDVDRRARAHHRRRQHGDGLLPHVAAPRRQRRQGHRAPAAQVLQGVAVGARGRRGRAGRDRREPRAEALRLEDGKLDGHGVRAARVVRGRQGQAGLEVVDDGRSSRATTSSSPSARRTRSRGSSATSASSSTSGTCRSSTRRRSVDARRACSSAATRRGARRTSSGPSSTATRRRSRSTTTARACRSPSGPPQGMNLVTPEDGHARVELQQRLQPGAARTKMKHVDLVERFKALEHRGRAGLQRRADGARGRALPQLRRADGLHREAVHRVRRVHRRLPGAAA